MTLFGANLGNPYGAAFDADGNLYVADGRSDRVLRFRAPAPPIVAGLPAFTNQSPLTVAGTGEPNGRVDLFINDDVLVRTTGDAVGAFSLAAPLTPDSDNALEAFATGYGEAGG